MQADAAARRAKMMDAKQMGKQMMDLYKTSFDNSYSAMMMLQEQMERMGAMYWGQMVNLPEEAKKGLTEWTKSYKKNCADFKKAVDDGFQKTGIFPRGSGKSGRKSQDCLKDWRDAGDQPPAFIVFEPSVTIYTAWPSLKPDRIPRHLRS
jgi:hypothetical protein